MITLIAFFCLAIFSLTYLSFYGYVYVNAKKPWNLKIDKDYVPSVSILVPVHNEENNIEKKLENLQQVDYPKEMMQVIIVDDASEDNSVAKINNIIKNGLGFQAKLVKQEVNHGKAVALNAALKFATAPIIIVTDADTTWPTDALKKAVPYLADPTVGAITGQGLNKQTSESWVTKNEDNYLQLTSVIRLGESKIHSTIRFEGGFCAYKRVAFSQFDCESGSDDSGTALEVIQHNYRTILAPEVVFYTTFPTSLKGKLQIKVRRATQLIGLWVKCLKSMFKKQLAFPKRIVIPEVLLFIINPVVFVILVLSGISSVLLFPFSYFSMLLIAVTFGLLIFARHLFQEVVFDNLLLFYASVSYLFGRRYVSWKKTN
jgi:cellulose synthase/poly-beta-1,6-N-acetylglucosamine synthase-like glycosyltransferase